MATKTVVKAIAGFEEDYNKYIERKAQVEDEVKKEFEQVLADRTKTLDELINIVSETIEVEVEDEEVENGEEFEDPNEYAGV